MTHRNGNGTYNGVSAFLGKVYNGFQRGDGDAVCLLFRPDRATSGSAESAVTLLSGLPPTKNEAEWAKIEALCQSKFTEPVDDLVLNHLKMIATISPPLQRGTTGPVIDFFEAYRHAAAATTGFLRAFESMEKWANPILFAFITNLQVLAAKADASRKLAPGEHLKSEDAARILLKAFHVCQMDRSSWENSRKSASLHVVTTLFKIYFRLKQHRLCQPLIRAIGNDSHSLDKFPASSRVTFKFYTGLLAFYEENFAKAETDLAYALRHCHKKNPKNKRTILGYLIPIKLLRGKGVNAHFVQKLGLHQFVDLIQSLKLGNLRRFNETLRKNERFFILQGIYLIVEKLKLLVYLRLFKRVFVILGKNTKLPLATFQRALQVAGETLSMEEVECIFAVLIDKGCIKGYLSREKLFLVLSQATPFPIMEDFM